MTDDPMIELSSEMLEKATTLVIAFGAILVCALWAVSFSHSCSSDGCIGIIVPAGAALATLGVQLFVLIPVDAVRTSRRKKPVVLRAVIWTIVSIAAFGVPLLFTR